MLSQKLLLFLIAALIGLGCAQQQDENAYSKPEMRPQDFHPTLYKILEAHGGIEKWQQNNTLHFTLGEENHTIDIHNRRVRIETPNYTIGSDEDNHVWLAQDSTYYTRNARFYHSLMFYFHTMPFVLADDGIIYEEIGDTDLAGKIYRGIKISYEANVGDADQDQYILYYDPGTYKMEWLAYTATYFSGQKSDRFSLIKYNTWSDTTGFLLPTELIWHRYSDGVVGDPAQTRLITGTSVSRDQMTPDYYAIPDGSVVDSAKTR